MGLIYDKKTIEENFPKPASASQWTVLIPAAGKGSRLGFDLPKILFPLMGRTILSHLAGIFSSRVNSAVIVCAPEGQASIAHEARGDFKSVKTVMQKSPRGMADAIWCARDEIRTKFCLVVWGDQVLLKEETIDLAMRAHQHRSGAQATVPTIMKSEPYIHFERDENGRVVRVQQRREGEITVTIGENDAGLFCFTTETLFDYLETARNAVELGAETGEFNLLPLLPLFESGESGLCTLRILSAEETVGVNDRSEAAFAEQTLRARRESKAV